jgi:FAS-associated factor 2
MSNPDLIQYLQNQFIFWACSKNLPEGQKVFNALKAKRCPFIGVIVYKHSRMTLISKIEGPITASELMLQLSSLIAEHEQDLIVARLDKEQRNQTQLLRQEQDKAYQESLNADREKAKKKQQLEEAKRAAELLEQQRIEEEKAKENVGIFLWFFVYLFLKF